MVDEKPIIARGMIDAKTLAQAFGVHHGANHSRSRWIFFGIGVIFGLAGLASFRSGNSWLALFWLLLGAFFFLTLWWFMLPHVLRKRLKKQYAQMGKEVEEVLFEFWPDRFVTQTKDSDSSLAWTAVRKWKEGSGLILLYRHNDFFHVVPVGQFDEDCQQALRMLLHEKLGLPSQA